MDITTYAERLRQEAAAATALAGPEVREMLERLLVTLDPAVRLILLEALSDAAAEISAEIPRGSVDARLRGGEVEFVLDGFDSPAEEPQSPFDGAAEAPEEAEDDGDTIRITLRLPANLKGRAEDQAAGRNLSLNTWLVEAVRQATRPTPIPPEPPFPPFPGTGRRSSRRMSGWA